MHKETPHASASPPVNDQDAASLFNDELECDDRPIGTVEEKWKVRPSSHFQLYYVDIFFKTLI